jgi:glutamate-5-semialdehyde dehydrogenase
MSILEYLKKTKIASYDLAILSEDKRNSILTSLAEALLNSCDKILDANAKDLAKIDKHNPQYDRLQLTESRVKAISDDIKNVTLLPFPIFKNLETQPLPAEAGRL